MLQLTKIERERLEVLQKREKDNHLYIRITVLLMLDDSFSVKQISRSLGLDQTTINRYIHLYEEQGLEAYLTLNYVGYTGKLTPEQEAHLDKELQENLYINTQEIIDLIQKMFGATYCPSGVSRLLHRLDFSYKKTKHDPSKADKAAQKAFLAEMLLLLDGIKDDSEDSVAYFVDAVHPQHNTRSDYAWIKKGQDVAIAANAGRKRINIHGALNAHDVTDVVIDEAPTVSFQSTQRLIEKIVQKHPFETIYLIHDNARYYYAKQLKEWLLSTYPSVKQIYLPAYSPNLNLIERLWKFLRKEVISYNFFPTFDEFKDKVLEFFKDIGKYKNQLASLLTLNFHIA